MLSVQPGLRGSNDLRVGRKMATLQLFFFSRVGLRTYQQPCRCVEFSLACVGVSVEYWNAWPSKMEPTVCPETSVRDYYSTLRNIAEDRRSPRRKPQIIHNELCLKAKFVNSTKLRARRPRISGSIPFKSLVPYGHHSHRIWGPCSLLGKGYKS